MPTQRQRASARQRAHAIKLGMRVSLRELPSSKAKFHNQSLPVYTLVWQQDDKALAKQPPWQLLRVNYAHDIHVYQDWDWANKDLQGSPRWRKALAELIRNGKADPLFDLIVAIEWHKQGVQIYWQESDKLHDVDKIFSLLKSLKAFGSGDDNALP